MNLERNISFEEYLKENQFRKKYGKKVIIFTILLILFSSITIGSIPLSDILIFFISMFLIGALLIYIITKLIYLKHYNTLKKSNKLKYNITFYDTYFKITKENKTIEIEYQKIKMIEEETYFFTLILDKKKILIMKKECDKNLIDLIRNLKRQKEEMLLEDETYQNTKRRMKFLFALTILSLWLALISVTIVTEILNTTIYDTKYMWIMWLWLPVPTASIILGIKYKKQGLKCLKNIIGGLIIAFLLIIYGCFTFLSNNEVDYQKVNTLEEILNINLPESGKYYKTEWDTNNMGKYIIHDIYFTNKNEYTSLEQEIKEDNRWILKNELKSQLELLIPNNMSCQSEYTCYYAIYIKEIEEYNKLPEEDNFYHIYALVYILQTHQLHIEEYNYHYKI